LYVCIFVCSGEALISPYEISPTNKNDVVNHNPTINFSYMSLLTNGRAPTGAYLVRKNDEPFDVDNEMHKLLNIVDKFPLETKQHIQKAEHM
jgi:hypothetical protein